MTDRVLIQNTKTGAYEIHQLGYFLPVYDIGDVVGFKLPQPRHEEHLPVKFGESAIVGIQADIQLLRSGEIVSAYIYTLEDNTEIMEEEVEYYYGDDVDTTEVEEETIVLDERDPSDTGAS